MKKPITIVGAGLAGSLLSVYLTKRSYPVEIFERRPDMRKTAALAGRSINLALSVRGIHALKEIGLYESVAPITIPMRGRMMHAINGDMNFVAYGKNESEVIYSVSRADLNMKLMTLAESHGARINFNQRCIGMNFETRELALLDEETQKEMRHPTATVIGTDGSASALRMEMQKTGRFNFSQEYIEHGYKELTIPASEHGTFQLEKNALHIWPRKTYMLIALPNMDGSFTCTLFLPMEGELSFHSLDSSQKIRSFFEAQFADASHLMPDLEKNFIQNPTGTLMTVRCFPWSVGDRALLLGDASHAVVPFFGQGMNCSFEDCTVLNECIERNDTNWNKIFSEFQSLRKANTDAIANLAVENFIEMRDLVAEPKFLLKKRIEHALEEKFPEHFVPKYGMVSFHRLPYSIALDRGKIQDEILELLAEGIDHVSKLNLKKAKKLILEKLPIYPIR